MAASASAASMSGTKTQPIWWSNAVFFVGMHCVALAGATLWSPIWQLDVRTAILCFVSWQLATYGITVGYHRLWSHRAFTASPALRVTLAAMGCLGFQGSIRWWVLRHRLHHRFTDTEDDPYNAKKGLYWSHMGWIFRKPHYPKMALVDRKDLDIDAVVSFQHRHYVPLTIGFGLVLPTLIGASYGDALGGFVYGGVVARLLIWHFTFCINSLAHFVGEQAYTLDVTARGNFLLAIFTGGEACHNFHHAFSRDYRNGPRATDWDPSKWIIWALHRFTPFVRRVHMTSEQDILQAQAHVQELKSRKGAASSDDDDEHSAVDSPFTAWSNSYDSASSGISDGGGSSPASDSDSPWPDDTASFFATSSNTTARRRTGTTSIPTWTKTELLQRVQDAPGPRPLLLVLEGHVVDATHYVREHPGGAQLLRQYAVSAPAAPNSAASLSKEPYGVPDATDAFLGGLNRHGWSAKQKARSLRIAKLVA